jgi:bile acid-coenzyme A ligase
VHAIVQPRGSVTEEELSGFLADRLVRYKIPRSYEFTDEPLRDDAGKVRRSQLREERIRS